MAPLRTGKLETKENAPLRVWSLARVGVSPPPLQAFLCSQQPTQLNLTQTPCGEGSGEFIHWTVVVSIIIDLPISGQGGKLGLRGWTRKSGKFKRIREVQGFVRMCVGLGQEGIQSSWRGAGSSLDTSSWRQAGGAGWAGSWAKSL